MKTLRHICAVIPTFNNAGTIADVVTRVAAQMDDIIVVVDGSTDATRDVLGALQVPFTLIDLPVNRGKGAALRQGLQKAREMGFTHVLTIDADGQHLPEEIPLLYRAHTVHPDAIIVGSRVLKQKNMPAKNTFANRFSNFWFAVQTGLRLPDTQSGLRIYPLHRLHGERLMTARYEAELTLLVFSAWANTPVIPVPVRAYYPPVEERVSHFRPAYDFTRISLLNTVLCVLALVYGLPRRWWRTVVYFTFFALYLLLFVHPLMWGIRLRYGNTEEMHLRLHAAIRKYVRHLFRAIPGVPLVVRGGQPLSVPAIYVANHNSIFDILALMALHDRVCFVTKEWVLHNPLFGRLAQGFDIIPARLGLKEMQEAVRERVQRGYSIVIFPEGTRSLSGDLGTFHRGAFYFAGQLGLPVQPVVLRGCYDLFHKHCAHLGKPSRIEMWLPTPPVSTYAPDEHGKQAKQMAAFFRERLDQFAYPYDED